MFKGYRTLIFNAIMTILMVTRVWKPEAELPDAEAVGGAIDALTVALATVWGIGNAIFRAVTDTPIGKKVNGTTVSSPAIVGVLAIILASLALSGCAGTRAAYQAADGIEQTAKVMGEHYSALVHSANNLKDAGKLAGSDLVAVQGFIAKTEPLMYVMAEAGKAFKAVQSADTEAALQEAMFEAAKVIDRLIDALKGRDTTGARVDDDYPPSWEAVLHVVT